MENPFAVTASEEVQTAQAQESSVATRVEHFYRMQENGKIAEYKIESGIEVQIREIGTIQQMAAKAMEQAALCTPTEAQTLNLAQMSHLELAALKTAQAASQGCLKSTQEMFDRIAGRPKQFTENTNVTVTLDDVLKELSTPIIDAQAHAQAPPEEEPEEYQEKEKLHDEFLF